MRWTYNYIKKVSVTVQVQLYTASTSRWFGSAECRQHAAIYRTS